MSWFGFGGGDKKDSASAGSVSDPYGGSSSQWNEPSTTFGSPSSSYSAASSGKSFQEEIQLEAQKIEIQGMILQLTATAFDKCVTKPGSSLSSSETSCIEATVGKHIEARALLMQKMVGGH